jgi:hypothetical protein
VTSIIHDYDAIRPGRPEAEPVLTALAALIAEERRAWDAYEEADEKAERLGHAWRRKESPDDKRPIGERVEEHLAWIAAGCPGAPAPIAALYAEAETLKVAANDPSERVESWVPDNLGDAIRLLGLYRNCRRSAPARRRAPRPRRRCSDHARRDDGRLFPRPGARHLGPAASEGAAPRRISLRGPAAPPAPRPAPAGLFLRPGRAGLGVIPV